MKTLKYILLFVLITTSGKIFSQNMFFPNKYDFKPVVQLTGNNNNVDRGILYAIENDIIVIQSFNDMKLYGYQLDSITKIKLKKGPGFLKVGTPVFIAFSSLLIGADLYAITLGAGIEMIPASAFIPIVALPAAVIAGTIGYIASTSKEYEVNSESMAELKTKLYQYSIYDKIDTLNYLSGNFNGVYNKGRRNIFQNKKIGLNVYFGANTKFSNTKNVVNNLLESYEFTNVQERRINHFLSYYFGLSYDISSKFNVGFEYYGDPDREITLDIIEPNEASGYLKFSFSENSELGRNIYANYTIIGDNKDLKTQKLTFGLGLLKSSKTFVYEIWPFDFNNVIFSQPYGSNSNYAENKDYGCEISSTYFVPLKGSATLNFKAYANIYPKMSFSNYRMTYVSSNESIYLNNTNVRIPEFGFKASLMFHL